MIGHNVIDGSKGEISGGRKPHSIQAAESAKTRNTIRGKKGRGSRRRAKHSLLANSIDSLLLKSG